ncbi:MAG TPA: hypothetical protein PKL73_12180 [Polyangiaceae bacterium]|nr:hypothetical protein [Polyangiaceae bacterium]HOR36849.1 hypothetical protein [Polyangiaceae bacterium]
MKISHWLIVASFIAPVFACSSSDDNKKSNTNPGEGGSGGSGGGVLVGGSGGGSNTGGGNTGGSNTGGSNTGGSNTGGGNTGGTGGGSSSACGLSFPGAPAACNSCFQDKCENQCVDVQSDPDFNAYQGCLGSCAQGDTQCQNDCDKQFPDLAAKFDTFVSCISSQCANECGAGGCIISMTDPTCGGCATANCNDVCETYSELPNAVDHLNCVIGCNDNDCTKGCDQTYPEEGKALDAYFACLGDKCDDECPGFGPSYPICDSGLAMGNESCATCLGDSCCNEVKACEADQNCLACITGTGGTNCEKDPKMAALETCWGQHCESACKTTGKCTIGFTDPSMAACNDCMKAKCEKECIDASDADGLNAYLKCAQGCTDQACLDNCGTQYPAAAAAIDALDSCLEAKCKTECTTTP